MPRFRLLIHGALACLLILFHFGCASKNDQAATVNAAGEHPADWLVAHRAAFQNAPEQCAQCHGADLTGGIAHVDCFNQAGLATCHFNGHPPRLANHPLPFTDPALHGALAKQDLTGCQPCHALPVSGGPSPRFNVRIGLLVNGCEDCHPARAAHPATWVGHRGSLVRTVACGLCHGPTLTGGAGFVGPNCSGCHNGTVPILVAVPGTCTSCHAPPPDGAAAPNRNGSHQVHNTLALAQGNCSVCHAGAGTGTTVHYARVFSNATVAVRATYYAKSGPASYNTAAQTCAGVKCHGGLSTPAWGTPLDPTGTPIALTTQCLRCHQDDTARFLAAQPLSPAQFNTTQYNSFFSGRHALHTGPQVGANCRDCHDMSAAAHFGNLSSAGFEQPASGTIRGFINYVPAIPQCSPPPVPPNNLGFVVGAGVCHSAEIGTQRWLP